MVSAEPEWKKKRTTSKDNSFKAQNKWNQFQKDYIRVPKITKNNFNELKIKYKPVINQLVILWG